MLVYSLLEFVDYEGSELLGVFLSRESALECLRRQHSWGQQYAGHSWGIVESELGVQVDVYADVEYVD